MRLESVRAVATGRLASVDGTERETLERINPLLAGSKTRDLAVQKRFGSGESISGAIATQCIARFDKGQMCGLCDR